MNHEIASPTMPQTEAASPRWRWLAAGALALVALAVNFDAWSDMLNIARVDEEASHIWLVPIIAGWLVYHRRSEASQLHLTTSLIGPLIIATGWLVAWYGFGNAVQSFWHGGAVLMVVGAFLTPLGIDPVRRYWPAFVVLLFLIPVPGSIRQAMAIPMQQATAVVTQFACDVIGMTVERHGSVLVYNGQDIAIAEACNGMRMVFTLVLVSFAYAFGTSLRPWIRVLIILVSPLSAIVCNVIRLVPTVFMFGHTPHDVADSFHTWAGWAMIVVALLLVMGLVKLLDWLGLPVYPEATTSEVASE